MTYSTNTSVITVGGSVIPLFYYVCTLYICRTFSSQVSSETSNLEKPLFLSAGTVSDLRSFWLPLPPPPTRVRWRGSAGSGGGWGRAFLRGGEGGQFFCWVESNGLAGTRVSGGCRNWDPRSLHWPGCLSGPPRTACGAGGRSNRDRDSSFSDVSSFCGGWDPLPLGVSGIAAGSERGTHLPGKGRKTQSNTHRPHNFSQIIRVLLVKVTQTCSPHGGCVVIVVGGPSFRFRDTVL